MKKLFLSVLISSMSLSLTAMEDGAARYGFKLGMIGGAYDGYLRGGHAGTGFLAFIVVPTLAGDIMLTPTEKVAFFKSALLGYLITSAHTTYLAKNLR